MKKLIYIILFLILANINLLAFQLDTFPDMPETFQVNIHTMSDFTPADPGEGINLIDPPIPNHLGMANMSFEIDLPQGRNDMAPDVSIVYSSNNQHTWLGHGWDISQTHITVETRWGVPRYNATVESETYLLGSDQLYPVAHRDFVVDRTPEKRFYPRVEGDFMHIIRHGNSPKNYWWEVTEKDGTKNYYGGHPTSGMDPNAVLRDDNGNIAEWHVTMIEDVFSNNIIYSYDIVSDPGVSGSSSQGREIYLTEITYTGFQGEQGLYHIEFIRDRELGESLRPDKDITANQGFKNVTADLLRSIKVSFQDELIRSYKLNYEEGAFRKTLLSSIEALDNSGNLFYDHAFEYYNDLNNGAYQSATIYNFPNDNLKGNILNPIRGFTGHVSALGGTQSNSFSGGTAVTVGPIGSLATKDISAGGSFFITNASGEGLVALVDLNGDNLPDKVFRKSGTLYYRKNMGVGNAFGDRVKIEGINQFSEFSSNGTVIGVEAHPPFSFVGYNDEKSKTNIKTYFTDYNGDGLIDIVRSGKVYFNHLNGEGHPVFTLSSGDTPVPIETGAPIDMDAISNGDDQEELEDQFPLHDVVRMWRAPHDGTIDISAPINLIEDTSEDRQNYGTADGVEVSIQIGSFIVWKERIAHDDYTVKVPGGLTSINVSKGRQIYFRVNSVEDGAYDQVSWNPQITYTDLPNNCVDANAKFKSQYKASEDFNLSSCQMIKMPFTGKVKIEGSFEKPITSDSITVFIYQTFNSFLIPIFTKEISWDSTFSGNIEMENVPIIKDQEILFRIHSDTQVDWSSIHWTPRIYYTETENDMEAFDEDGQPTIAFCPAPEYIMYNDPIILPEVAQNTTERNVEARVSIPRKLIGSEETNATFSVKSIHELIYKKDFTISTGNHNEDFQFTLPVRDSIFFEVHIRNGEQGRLVDDATIEYEVEGENVTYKVGVVTGIDDEDLIFGPLYRGWGQFAYNSNDGRSLFPIDQSKLTLESDEIDEDFDYEGIEDTDDLEGIYNPTSSVFILLISEMKTRSWRGSDDLTYVTKDVISSSRMGEDNISLEGSSGGSGATAPTLIITNKLRAIAGGLSIGPASASGSKAWSTSKNIIDFKDFNGDGYPDIVTDKSIQYTNPRGGLESTAITHGLGNHEAKSSAEGFTLGGTFVNSSPTNSGGTSGAGSVKRTSRRKSRTNKGASKSKSATKSSKGGMGISASFTDDEDETNHSWMDINGDGLPDKVFKGGRAALNYGYKFGPREIWGFDYIRKGVSEDFGGGIGINISNGSIAGGISTSRTEYYATHAIQDINGDGLVDVVVSSDPMKVRFNTGSGFTAPQSWDGLNKLDEGSSTGESVNAAFTVCIPIFFVRFCTNPSTSIGRGVDRPLNEINDIDNDGYPDILTSNADGKLTVRKSKIGRTNLLKKVTRPLGAEFTIDYTPITTDSKNPNSLWAFTSVEMYDGYQGDGADYIRNQYEYEEGNYDRNEKEFYGFKKVIDRQLNTERNDQVAREVVYTFHNENYYLNGKLRSILNQDTEGNKYKEVTYTYALMDIENGDFLSTAFAKNDYGMAFPALLESRMTSYEEKDGPGLTSTTRYSYDTKGNVTEMVEDGQGHETQYLRTTLEYQFLDDILRYDKVIAEEKHAQIGLREKVENEIDELGRTTAIKIYINEDDYATINQEWNEYGRITKVIRPENYKGERLAYTYTYDDVIHDRIILTKDSYGYKSRDSFEFVHDRLIHQTDLNGQEIKYTIDHLGRYTSITGPKEINNGIDYTIKYTYDHAGTYPYSMTAYYNPDHNNDMEVYTFIDGLGREVQTKTTGAIFRGKNQLSDPVMIVSGRDVYDCLGRLKETYYPTTTARSSLTTPSTTIDNVAPMVMEYDILDRVTSFTHPNGGRYTIEYSIDNDINGIPAIKSSVTDPNGVVKDKFTDAMGRVVSNRKDGPYGDIWTQFIYDNLAEMTGIIDDSGNETSYIYDWMGRRIETIHPDGGSVVKEFDHTNNVIKKITPEIRNNIPNGGGITYQYDHERLIQIDFPKNIFNRVQLSYGTPDADHNRAGRIWLQQDASGGQEYFFDEYGNSIKNIRSVLINGANLDTYVWESRYDTWNRLDSMYYPDGELITYTYNDAGSLVSMQGIKDDVIYDYLKGIGYDKFDQKVYTHYGNDVENNYIYSPDDRRIDRIISQSGNRELMALDLDHDQVGNITNSSTEMEFPGTDEKIVSNLNMSYDEMYRLSQSQGSIKMGDTSNDYNLLMDYDNINNIMLKSQSLAPAMDTSGLNSYTLDYQYDTEKPHTPAEIGGQLYTFDDNGNTTGYSGNGIFRYNRMNWDEENRLMSVSNDGAINQITYDASGERVVRSHGGIRGVFVNGAPAGVIDHKSDYFVDVSPYFKKTKDAFYKHYYIGDHRFLIKEGLGSFDNKFWPNGAITAGNLNYISRMQQLQSSLDNYYIDLGIPPGPPTLQGYYGQPEYTSDPFPIAQQGLYNAPPRNWPQPTFNPDTTGAPGPPVWFSVDSLTNDNVSPGYGFSPHKIGAEIINAYLHVDHTMSTIITTDYNGEVSTSTYYSPFGEILHEEKMDERMNVNYRFNNKSYDPESNNYYYGARYLDTKTSLWNSIDPYHEEVPGWSPYSFAFLNPGRYIDEDGNLPGELFSSPEKAAYDFGKIYNPKSFKINREYGAQIYRVSKNGKNFYTYAKPLRGTKASVKLASAPKGFKVVADVHSHGAHMHKYKNNDFSSTDMSGNANDRTIGFVTTPDGSLKKYNPWKRKTTVVSRSLPYDNQHYTTGRPNRINRKREARFIGTRSGNVDNRRNAVNLGSASKSSKVKKNNRKVTLGRKSE
ncbi:MAG: DUF4329 domain-containing protein [Saprospiraceae bacterium]|nr:DUF4329 domain-containing protein [Saprospiraceae bacterium]